MSEVGTNRTNRADLMMSAPRGNPEVSGPSGPALTQCMVRPRVASGFAELAVSGLASMYPASDWSICSGPSWISARVRSH